MVGSTSNSSNVYGVVDENSNPYRNTVMEVMRMNQGHAGQFPIINEKPNADVVMFFNLLKDSDDSLWDGSTNHSKLLVVT
jgi:hypothetical protein